MIVQSLEEDIIRWAESVCRDGFGSCLSKGDFVFFVVLQ